MVDSIFSNSYSYAMDIDDRLRNEFQVFLSPNDFNNLINVLQYPQTENGQRKFFEAFNQLDPDEFLLKVTQVSALVDVLRRIKKNSIR